MSKKPFVKIKVAIEKISSKGFGVGFASKAEGTALHKIEIPHTVPGDLIEAEIGRKRNGAFLGYFPNVLQPSENRVDTKCKHAEYCGGCMWQQMSYIKQLEQKQKYINSLFKDLCCPQTEISPIIACEDPWKYRNKMEYTFSQNKAGEKFLGLIMTGGKGRVFNLTECHLTDPWFHNCVNAMREFWINSSLEAYDMRSNRGSLRNLTLRKGIRTGCRLAMITVSGNPEYAIGKNDLQGIVDTLLSTVDEAEKDNFSIFIRVQQIIKGSPTQFYEMHLHGPDYLKEELFIESIDKKFAFKISPTAFFQPNTLQAEKLYSNVLKLAGDNQLQHVLDLYAGTSTLGIFFSSKAKHVTSIEINPHATFDAEVNKEWNEISNLTVKKGDVAEVLSELRKDPSFSSDLVVVDPPRAGLDNKALSHLIEIAASKIIYISCNPSTQAENLKYLTQHGYSLIRVQPVDQFPHTIHVENICLLEKIS